MHPHDESRLPPRSAPHQHEAGGWEMPPMHPAVPWMVPGLEALTPAEPPWLPGSSLDSSALEPAGPSRAVELRDGDTVRLVAGPVRRTIGGRTFVGYAYNGQIPGPLLRAPRGATVNVEVVNRLELPTAIHWHGIRLDNPSDGVPGHTQPPIAPGERYRYQVKVPDAGIYWYHPHVREDAAQDLGLAANFLVTASGPDALVPVDREAVLLLDDMLLGSAGPIPWGRDRATHALMGRFGNVLLVNGATSWRMTARAGEVVRLFLTNAANARVFNLSIPGARLKLVGGDVGPLAREEWVDHVVLAPAERYIVDVRLPIAGQYPLLNQVRPINHPAGVFFSQVDTLGIIEARGPAATVYLSFDSLRTHAATDREIAALRGEMAGAPDYELVLSLKTRGLPFGLEQVIRLDTGYVNPVEWEGTMPMMDWLATGREVEWILRDAKTGRENLQLGWRFRRGERARIRIVNERRVLHPMYHSIHLHGQRFLVVAQNGAPNPSLGWKDTVLVPAGSTVDLLVEFSNPGMWMLHCHLAEHLEAGMHAMVTVSGKR
jgi:FtsP/CotA-like multicopper oxidase with cupredoxin domain